MQNVDPNILRKIKKCLALANSSNPNEAATAMRQAMALMEKHGISSHQITMADIGEAEASSKTMSRDKPAHWEIRLVALISMAFGCQMMIKRACLPKGSGHINEGSYVFVGLAQQAEVAAYTATVLIRKCKAARQAWLKEFSGLGRGVKGRKAKMTRLGDMFAEGWVESIAKLVREFANPPEVDAAIKQHIEAQTTSDDDAPCRQVAQKNIGSHEMAAISFGMKAAKGETLHRPMESAQAPLALTAQ